MNTTQRPRLTIADFAIKPDYSALAIPTPKAPSSHANAQVKTTRNGCIVIRPDTRSWRDHAPKYRPGYVAAPADDEQEPPKS
jgi:hypothetical protein